MDPGDDEVAASPPSGDFMEGANVWLWDDEGRVAGYRERHITGTSPTGQ